MSISERSSEQILTHLCIDTIQKLIVPVNTITLTVKLIFLLFTYNIFLPHSI